MEKVKDVFVEEERHLKKVLSEIDRFSLEASERRRFLREKIRQERERIWEDYARGSANPSGELQEVVQISRTEVNDTERYQNLQTMIERFQEQRKTPYFARIDFCEKQQTETFYIGKISLVDPSSSEVYICDWRADISSLFYDFETGPAYYETGAGKIEGDILLRRQFKIENGRLVYVFESDLAVEDEILRDELGKSADLKLKTIVGTIQREQNRIIRDVSADILVVEGGAGSGKTSVALHRVAYLLYRYRNTLSHLNIIIFSPNSVFNSYIRDVLPELGEERVLQENFYDFFSALFSVSFETPGAFAERLMAGADNNELEKRGGRRFCLALESALQEAAGSLAFPDVVFPGNFSTVSGEEIAGYYTRFLAYPHEVRCQKVINILCEDFEDLYKERYLEACLVEIKKDPSVALTSEEELQVKEEEWRRCLESFRKQLNALFAIDIYSVYTAALRTVSETEALAFEKRMGEGRFAFSDLYPLTYLKALLGVRPAVKKISHIVIDEAQEYPAALFQTLHLFFPEARFTILGDLCQRSCSLDSGIEEIPSFFGKRRTSYCRLDKTYRCTREIYAYLQTLGGCPHEKWFDRTGEAVAFFDFKAESLVRYLVGGKNTAAVICRDLASAEEIFRQIKDLADAFVLTENGTLFPGKIAVIPSYLAKGLEFDTVALIRQDGFNETENQSMFYVGASRALHRLAVFRWQDAEQKQKK